VQCKCFWRWWPERPAFTLGHIFPFQKPVYVHSQYRRWVSIANPDKRGACLTSCSSETLRFPSSGGTCPLFKTPRAVVLPTPSILLTVTQPDVTWSDNKWCITSLYWRTVWPMSIGCIFCERGTIMISAEIPRECLMWQSNTNTSVSLHHWLTASGFFVAHSTTCWIKIVSASLWQFLRVSYFSGIESTVLILSGSSSKPETMTYCSPDKNCLTGSSGQLWGWWAALCSELPSGILTVKGLENPEWAHNWQHS